MVVSSRHATLRELDTVYGTEDLEDFIEVIMTDAHNARILARRREHEDGES